MKKNISLFLSTVIVTNIIGFSAMATENARINEALIDQSIAAQTNEMRRNLEQVNALIKSIENYRSQSAGDKQNAFVNAARLMITVLGLSSAAVHVKNIQAQSSAELTLAAVTGILSTVLEKYVTSQKIDMNEVKSLLIKNELLPNYEDISAISDKLFSTSELKIFKLCCRKMYLGIQCTDEYII